MFGYCFNRHSGIALLSTQLTKITWIFNEELFEQFLLAMFTLICSIIVQHYADILFKYREMRNRKRLKDDDKE